MAGEAIEQRAAGRWLPKTTVHSSRGRLEAMMVCERRQFTFPRQVWTADRNYDRLDRRDCSDGRRIRPPIARQNIR